MSVKFIVANNRNHSKEIAVSGGSGKKAWAHPTSLCLFTEQ